MKASEIAPGICKTPSCSLRAPVERYDGPGMFCPECGELLEAFVPVTERTFQMNPIPAPTFDPVALSANPRDGGTLILRPAPVRTHSFGSRALKLACISLGAAGSIALCAAGVLLVLRSGFMAPPPQALGVCHSSMSGHLEHDVFEAYAAHDPVRSKRFDVQARACDVRFLTTIDTLQRSHPEHSSDDGAGSGAIGRNAIVAVVNPHNTVNHLGLADLRGLFSGRIRDWKSVGGRKGRIAVILPTDVTDEAKTTETLILKGLPVGLSVYRVPSSADVVRVVTTSAGRDAIGIVAFDEVGSAKVLTIDHFPVPTAGSIDDRTYPLGVALTVRGGQMNDPAVAGLVRAAVSHADLSASL